MISRQRSLHVAVVAGLLTLAFIIQFALGGSALSRLDGLAYDQKLNLMSPLPDTVSNIHIVDIDERSLYEIQRMPWQRDLYAALVDKLTEMGAIVIAFDILFSEPQPNPALPVLEKLNIESAPNIISNFDYDQILAETISDKEIVFGMLLHHQPTLRKGILSVSPQTQPEATEQDKITEFSGYAGVIDILANNATGIGFMNSVEDEDGFVRRAALVSKIDNKLYPALAVETFRVYSLADKLEPVWHNEGSNRFMEGLKIGTSLIPTDNHGRILIPFRGPARTYPYTSAADVLQGNLDPSTFDQAVVFVGTSSTGLADLRVTPVNVSYPGVEIHATVFEALMTPEYLVFRPDWWQGAVALKLVFIAVLILLLMPRLGAISTFAATTIILAMIIGSNAWLWRYQHIDLPIVTSLILTILLAAYFTISGFLSESNKRRQVKAIFDQYVPPAHIDQLLNAPEALSLDGEKKELSVMFSDIRSFTTISESMSAQDLKRWLNEFFSPITRVIFENDGTIDKYVGDMVMAFWGAPLDDPEHANKSIQASFDMLNELEKLNKTFKAENKPLANIGVGINTGDMNVGDMGSDYRRSYTVIGDAVNLGSRLEGLTKFYGLTILVSEFTQALATDFDFLLVDKVKVKGKLKPVTIYTPLIKGSLSNADKTYQEAIDLYFNREFENAKAKFEEIETDFQFPVLAKLYVERSQAYIDTPPAPDWDGSYTHTSK